MHDVRQWLESIGLGQHADRFEEHAIDSEVLPELTEVHLEQIGVPLGHRIRMLKAIAQLEPAPAGKSPADAATDPAGAERRQVTVMFCDLVGSTRLSQQLDPEDMREVLVSCQDAWKGPIESFGGFIARYMGDGVLAYFGYPRAHEDDAERAVRAGLAVVEAMTTLRERHPGVELRVRIGIATGRVVVGDLVGEGAAQERAIVGETPNLAARLQGEAEPDSIVIAPGTRALVAGRFDFDELGPLSLRGIEEPVHGYRVVGGRESESRLASGDASAFTDYVGRAVELGILDQRWAQARARDGQIVLLSGEPGIGKSRAVRQLLEAIEHEAHTRITYQCSPFHTNSPLKPVIAHITRAAGIDPADSPDRNLDRLETLFGRDAPELEATMPLLAELLAVPWKDRYAAPALTPQRQKEKTLEALVQWLVRLSEQRPLLLVFEDVHWVDPTTQELLDRTMPVVRDLPVLMIATYRPEYLSPWVGQANTTLLQLARLGAREAAEMVRKVPGARILDDATVDTIVRRSDGVPLFLEELARVAIDDGAEHETAVPSSVQASLLARLDRLGEAKELAQIAAVLGRDFGYALLRAVSGRDESRFAAELESLVGSGLVLARGVPPESTYRFKHALVQDAAYDSLLRARRRNIHGAVATALEVHYRELAETQPDLLAHHRVEAGDNERAVHYLLRAGQQAASRSAFHEAVAFLDWGLECLATLPASRARDERELDLQRALFSPVNSVSGYGSPRSMRTYDRARELCNALETPELLYPVLHGQWMATVVQGEMRTGKATAIDICALGETHGDDVAMLQGARMLGWSELFLGNLGEAREHIQRALDLFDDERHHDLKSQYSHDPRCASLSPLTLVESLAGRLDRARAASDETIGRARALAHTNTLTYVLLHGGVMPAMLAGDVRRAGPLIEELVALSEGNQMPFFIPWARAASGWHRAKTGGYADGVALLREGLEGLREMGQRYCVPLALGCLAELELEAGDAVAAEQVVADAVATVEATGERMLHAEIRRLEGRVAIIRSPDDRAVAERAFQEAREQARAQGATLIELRAAHDLARSRAGTERGPEARAWLGSACDRVSGGEENPGVVAARGFLAT